MKKTTKATIPPTGKLTPKVLLVSLLQALKAKGFKGSKRKGDTVTAVGGVPCNLQVDYGRGNNTDRLLVSWGKEGNRTSLGYPAGKVQVAAAADKLIQWLEAERHRLNLIRERDERRLEIAKDCMSLLTEVGLDDDALTNLIIGADIGGVAIDLTFRVLDREVARQMLYAYKAVRAGAKATLWNPLPDSLVGLDGLSLPPASEEDEKTLLDDLLSGPLTQGARAALDGKPATDNPYAAGTEEHSQWLLAYDRFHKRKSLAEAETPDDDDDDTAQTYDDRAGAAAEKAEEAKAEAELNAPY